MKLAVILHNIRSLHNVGSVFRTAAAAGVGKIYLSGITPCPDDRFGKIRAQVSKVALGGELMVPWEKKRSLKAVVNSLKKDGYKIVAVEQAQGSVSHRRIPKTYLRDKCALIFGSETKGLPPSALRLSDLVVEIPIPGGKQSLNVSVAAGIAIFAFINK